MSASQQIARQFADAEFAAAVAVVRKSVPTHAQLTALLSAVDSAALSFHEHGGYDNSGAVCDGITEAIHALEYCFHRSAA